MASADPDWFARIVSVLAFGISAATLIWSRLDKRRERKATDQASQPTVQMQWNPQVDGEGWYTLKLVFRDLSKPVLFDRVSVKSPAPIANRNLERFSAGPERSSDFAEVAISCNDQSDVG